jgi:hypothetical protein
MLAPDKVTDRLNACQILEAPQFAASDAEAVHWAKRGARIDPINPRHHCHPPAARNCPVRAQTTLNDGDEIGRDYTVYNAAPMARAAPGQSDNG